MTDYQNNGVIGLHRPKAGVRLLHLPRTVIVSGVARSGTSMVARLLAAAGLFMGDRKDDVVFEDHDFALLFEYREYDQAKLAELVTSRGDAHTVWGFKRPHLHTHGAGVIDQFRNPYVILTVRDPVAIAERNAIAEHRDAAATLSAAAQDLSDMIGFAQALHCPVLMVSYEKALAQPEQFIDTLLTFCGLSASVRKRRAMRALIEPGRKAYVDSARRVFEGYIDSIQGTVLSGWAWQRGAPVPLAIALLRDGIVVSNHMADEMRPDLQASGIGTGHHGFSIDLVGYGFGPHSTVGVKIDGRNFMLVNSGATVLELGGDVSRLTGYG